VRDREILGEAMRLAIVCPRVPRRNELTGGPLDAEWVVETAAGHDLELFVDRLSPTAAELRAQGVPVRESIKRWASGDDGTYRSADGFQARAILAAHRRSPFDAILYTCDVAVDLAWLEPELGTIPRGCMLGSSVAALRAVWQDEGLFSQLARRMWALAGLLASADFLIADVPPESFSLACGRTSLPPRLRSRPGKDVPRPTVPGRGLVVVVATTVGASDLEGLLAQAFDRVAPHEGLTFALVTGATCLMTGHLAPALESDGRVVPEQLLVVPAGRDGVAASFLENADLVLLASLAELSVPLVAEVASRRGSLLCSAAELPADEAPVLSRDRLRKRPRGPIHFVSFDELRCGALARPSSLGIEPDDLIVVYSSGGDRQAAHLVQAGGVSGADLVVWGQPAGLFGEADPHHVYPHACALRAEILPSLTRVAERAGTVWELVAWALDLDHLDRSRMLLLPAGPDVETRPLPGETSIRAPWIPGSGPLPPPRFLPASPPPQPPSPIPLLAPPRPTTVGAVEPRQARTLEHWLRVTRWPHRLMVCLPWRWGFLERAMREQW
jgi:hypothetical protein